MLALPIIGVISVLAACWANRRESEKLWVWGTVALMTLFATALTFWQIRAAPAAQLLAIPAAAWGLTTEALALLHARRRIKTISVAGVLLVLAAFNASDVYGWYNKYIAPPKPLSAKAKVKADTRAERLATIRKANARCRTLPALEVLNRLPPATIFTMVDLGPRLIATTHHSAIAGPYHRNGDAILAIHHAFDGQPEAFRAIAAQRHAAYLLFCPNFPEGTVYQSRSPKGFYAQLMQGKVPSWLRPVDLGPTVLPYTLYRIDYGS